MATTTVDKLLMQWKKNEADINKTNRGIEQVVRLVHNLEQKEGDEDYTKEERAHIAKQVTEEKRRVQKLRLRMEKDLKLEKKLEVAIKKAGGHVPSRQHH